MRLLQTLFQWLMLVAVVPCSTALAANEAPGFSLPPGPVEAWTARDAVRLWTTITCSADGTKWAAGNELGPLWTSVDSGATWTPRYSFPAAYWQAIVASADGNKMLAVNYFMETAAGYGHGSGIVTSSNAGTSWTRRGPYGASAMLLAAASSADGMRLAVAQHQGPISTSTDSGGTWTVRDAGARNWESLASSADGTKLIAGTYGDLLYLSSDSGATWTSTAFIGGWVSVACSADGTRIIAADVTGKQMYVSTDSGATWSATGKSAPWHSVACSADGIRIVAGAWPGVIAFSDDGGLTWKERVTDAPRNWSGVAITAEGTKMGATAYDGQIFISGPLQPYNLKLFAHSGAYQQPNFATHIVPGPSSEATQAVEFIVSNNNPTLFTSQPAIDGGGMLWFAHLPGATGSATVTVRARDDGGTANFGVDTSPPRTFVITLSNDHAPTDISLPATSIAENTGHDQFLGQLTGVDQDAGESLTYALVAGVGSADNASFMIIGNALWFSGRADYEAKASYSLRLRVTDSSGAEYEKAFVIPVRDLNEPPSFSLPAGTPSSAGDAWIGTNVDASRNYAGLASSADGTKLATVVADGFIYTSTDSGYTWTPRMNDAQRAWSCIACSADGLKLVAAVTGGGVYVSNDGGVTWKLRGVAAGGRRWQSVTSSGDGTKLAALDAYGYIWTSVNSGSSWKRWPNQIDGASRGMASSADGSKLIVAMANGFVYTSTDSGVTWTARLADGNRAWKGVASSADGSRLVAVAGNSAFADSQIYLSTDAGSTWTTWTQNAITWNGVACSSDGLRVFATTLDGWLYTSEDGGATWARRNNPWLSGPIATSADGTQLVGTNQFIYISVGTSTVAIMSDGSAYSQENFATNISPGPVSEAAQTVSFDLTNIFSSLFTVQPSIDSSGRLTFTPAANAAGLALVTVTAKDNGDPSVGGSATSFPQWFSIRVTPRVGPREINLSPANVFRNSPANSVVGTLSATNANPAATHVYTLVSGEGSTDNSLFSVSGNVLMLLPSTAFPSVFPNPTYDIRVRATDDEGLTLEKHIVIPVLQINRAPRFTLSTSSLMIAGTPGTVTIPGFLTNISPGAIYEAAQSITFSVTNDHAGYFNAQPVIDRNGTLTFTPLGRIPGPLKVTIVAKDSGGTANGGVDTSDPVTFTVVGDYGPKDITISNSSVAERNVPYTAVGTLAAVGLDSWDTPAFALVAGDGSVDNDEFMLWGSALQMKSRSDFEKQASYSIRVRVTNTFGSAFEKALSVSVLDTNDPPSFGLPAAAPGTQAGDFWTEREVSDVTRSWSAVASSANGMYLMALQDMGGLYTSGDGGASWKWRKIGTGNFFGGIAMSSDGSVLAATDTGGAIHVSTDFGVTWTARSTNPKQICSAIALSGDGSKMVAVSYNGSIFTSIDTGITWTERMTEAPRNWACVASSADGSKLVAGVRDGTIYGSADSGGTWTLRYTDANYEWLSLVSSADGTRLFAMGHPIRGSYLVPYRSTDSGLTWRPNPVGASGPWGAIAISADGMRLASAASGSTSSDGGEMWIQKGRLPYFYSGAIASSADGSKLVIGADKIYTSVGALTLTVPINSGTYSQPGFATSISPGPGTDAGQTVSFEVTSASSMFSVPPAIDASGTLTFTPAPGALGTAVVSVVARDNGGTANGGLDTSGPQYFFIKIPRAAISVEPAQLTPLVTLPPYQDGSVIDFGGRGVDAAGAVRTVVVRNTGNLDITGLALTIDGPNADDFTLTPLPVTLLPEGGAASFAITFKPLTTGARSAGIHLASSVAGTANPFDITLSGTGINPVLATWRTSHFGSATAKTGDNEDFNGDGVPNALEFAFGTSPERGGSGRRPLKYNGTLAGGGTIVQAGQPISVFEGGSACGLFVRRKDFAAAGLVYAPQFSADLVSWQTSGATPTVLADDGTFQVLCLPYPVLPGGLQARYFRVEVSLAP